MNQSTIIVIAVIVVIALLLLFLLRGRKQHVTLSDAAPIARPAQPAARSVQGASEGHGVASEAAPAIVSDQPASQQPQTSAGDQLTLLKGLGPKAASRLGELGVTRFDQIAAWDDNDVSAIDAQMGTFKGRITRDRWVQQARLLARGEREAFEAQFGKIGG